jgi:vitamin B12 transporter
MFAVILTLLMHTNADSLKVFRAPDVVVTSTRNAVSPQDSPSKVVSLDVKQLSALGFSDIGGILSSADGLFVKDYGPSQLSTISVRGTGAEETLFMIDGTRINSVQNGVVDLFLIPVSQIGHIEIAEGGSSSLFGADAMGGIIDLRTASKAPPGASASFGAGSYGYQQSRVSLNQDFGDASISIMAERTRARNNFNFDYSDGLNSYPMERTGADFVSDNEFAKIIIPGKESSTSIVVSNASANRGTPGPVTGPFFIGTQREYDGNLLTAIDHKTQVGQFVLSSSAGFTYSYLRYVDPPTVTGGYSIDDYYKMLSLQPSVRINYSSESFEGATGVDAEGDRGTSSEMSGAKDRTRGGAFASGIINLRGPFTSEIHVSPSARVDWYSDFGGSFNPKIGLNVKPIASLPFNIRGSIGTSFRAPTFNELYYASVGNASIKPEKSVNYDAGIVFSARTPVDLEADADFYAIDITDGIVWQPSSGILWRPVNYQKTLSRGIELSLQGNYNGIAALRANYSYGQSIDFSDPNSPTYGKQLIFRPEEEASFIAALSPWIATFSATLRYVGFRYTTAANDEFLPAFTTVDLSAGARIELSGFVLSPLLSLKNIFNTGYQVIPQYPMPMRTVYFSLSVQFHQQKEIQ